MVPVLFGVVAYHGIIVIVHGVLQKRGNDVFLIGQTVAGTRLFSRRIQCRQKHAGEDGDDGNYHEELYEGKSAGSAPDVWYETVPSVEFHSFRLSLVCVVSSLSFAGDEHVSGV